MLHRLFRASADRRAAEAETDRVLGEIREEKRRYLDKTYRDLESTQEIMDRVEARRSSRCAEPHPTLK